MVVAGVLLNPLANTPRVGDSKAACAPKLPDATSPKSVASPVDVMTNVSIEFEKSLSIPSVETALTPLDTVPISLAADVKLPKSVEFD